MTKYTRAIINFYETLENYKDKGLTWDDVEKTKKELLTLDPESIMVIESDIGFGIGLGNPNPDDDHFIEMPNSAKAFEVKNKIENWIK